MGCRTNGVDESVGSKELRAYRREFAHFVAAVRLRRHRTWRHR
jgi:hypothetical protein